MSAWRLDEVHAADEGGLIADLDVVPGDPNTRRRIERLERLVAEKPAVWQNRIALAQSFVQDGQFDRAAQQLRAGLDLVSDPRVLSALFFNLGVCEENQERWQQAAAAFEQCVFLMPQLYWGHYGLGVCLHRMGNHAAAMISLRQALALDPEIEQGHQAIAELYLEAGLLHEAEAECRWLLELDPDTIWAARTLVDLRGRLN
jgi:tetratricopeptide (TPR) repeat protein